MSDFSDEFSETAMAEIFDRMGDTAVYVDADGNETPLTADIGPESERDVQNRDGFERVRWRSITISLNPASAYGGVAAPKTNAHFVIEGEIWSIDGSSGETAGEITLEIFRTAITEVGPKNHARGKK
jgi:hypothetical protein